MTFSKLIYTAALTPFFVLASCSSERASTTDETTAITIMVGSYSNPADTALRVYSFNPADNSARQLVAFPVDNASFFTQSPEGIIYVLTETNSDSSRITAIAPDSSESGVHIIGSQLVGSDSPCYVTISPDGRFAVTADYNGSTASIFPLDENGAPRELSQRLYFTGTGLDTARQEKPHPHCIAFTPDGRFMLVDDLGTDRIHMFPVDSANCVKADHMTDITLLPGSGPRHIVFNKKGDLGYLINEISDSVTVLSYDGATLRPIQYIAANTVRAQGAGDIHLSPDGRYLYASLRLDNEGIAAFEVDPATGLLTYCGHTPTPGHPRNFMIIPDGTRMLVACRDADEVRIYTIDPESGTLTDSGNAIVVSRPVCVKAVSIK